MFASLTGGWPPGARAPGLVAGYAQPLGARPPVFPALESAYLKTFLRRANQRSPFAEALVPAQMAPQLKILHLDDSVFGHHVTYVSCNLAGTTTLTRLVLGGEAPSRYCPGSALHPSMWGALAALPALTELSVPCTPQELQLLSRLSALEALRAQVYHRNRSSARPCVANAPELLSAPAAIPRLRALRLELTGCDGVWLLGAPKAPLGGALTALTLLFEGWEARLRDAAQLAARVGLRRLVRGSRFGSSLGTTKGPAVRQGLARLAAEMAAEGLELEQVWRE